VSKFCLRLARRELLFFMDLPIHLASPCERRIVWQRKV
jgi:hypothetical protein